MFLKFMVEFSILTLLGFLYLQIYHVVKYTDSLTQICDNFYPCGFFFSHFTIHEKLGWSLTFFLFIIFGYAFCVYQWIEFDKKAKHYNLFLNDNIVYTRIFLNGWDWRMNTLKDANNMKDQVSNSIKLKIKDDETREEIKKRSKDKIIRLRIKRVFTMIISLIVLFSGWVGIVSCQVYQSNIQAYFTEKLFVICCIIAPSSLLEE